MQRRVLLPLILSLPLVLPFLAACAASSDEPEAVTSGEVSSGAPSTPEPAASQTSATITPGELLARLGTEAAPMVFDVRSPAEYRMGRIPGALNLEDRQVPSRIQELQELTDREIVVYCQVGPRARWVQAYLRQNGFTHVRHLVGDFVGWRRSGHPVE